MKRESSFLRKSVKNGIIVRLKLTMQFKIPQDVQREDHIVGPLTTRQLIICIIGGAVGYAIFVSLGKDYEWITWIVPVVLIALITITVAFVNPLDLRFERFIIYYFEYLLLPKKRYWLKGSADPLSFSYIPTPNKAKNKIEKKALSKAEKLQQKDDKLQDLSQVLDKKY